MTILKLLKQNLATNVRRMRRERDWREHELATYANVDPGTIRNIEQQANKGLPNLDKLQRIADALEVDVDTLLAKPGVSLSAYISVPPTREDAPLSAVG